MMEFREEALIERERELAAYLRQDLSIQEIIRKTGLHKKMIAAHLLNMMEKLHCGTKEELITLVKRGGNDINHNKT